MPLDVNLVREGVKWSTSAASAFRHGVQSLEDQLLGLGVHQAELDVRAEKAPGGEVDLHAVLKIGPDRLDANAEDLNLTYGITQVLEALRERASAERLFDDGRGPATDADAPWEEILSTVVALATHLVSRAVDLGDLPPGSVDPGDLADDALVTVLEGDDRSMRAVRQSVRAQLERRILVQHDRVGDLDLDSVAPPSTDPNDHDPYAFDEPDETPMREGDRLDPSKDLRLDGADTVDE